MIIFTVGIKQKNKLRSIIIQVSKVGLGEISEDTVSIFKEIIRA